MRAHIRICTLLIVLSLSLAACMGEDEDGSGNEAVFVLADSCLPYLVASPVDEAASGADVPAVADGSALPAEDEPTGFRILHVSSDSLAFIFPMVLNCGLEYSFTAAFPAPDTVAISESVVGGMTARCSCRKELFVALKARPGQDLEQVAAVKAGAIVHSLGPIPL